MPEKNIDLHGSAPHKHNIWQRFSKLGEAVKLVFTAHRAPALVISVLLPATRVPACRLDVAIR